jgi:hypothetical protein
MHPHISGTERVGFLKQDADLGRMANLKLVDKRGKELVKLKLKVLG